MKPTHSQIRVGCRRKKKSKPVNSNYEEGKEGKRSGGRKDIQRDDCIFFTDHQEGTKAVGSATTSHCRSA